MERNSDCWYTIYAHISPSNKMYIGITGCSDVARRWGANGVGYIKQKRFYRAIQKYGWDNFQHIILFSNVGETFALFLEQELIKMFNTTNKDFGYNISVGGNGIKGGSMSPVDREKMSVRMRELKLGKPSPRKGKHLTDEHKERIRQSLLGHKHSEETKRKIGDKSRGRTHTQQAKEKIGAAKLGNTYCLGKHWKWAKNNSEVSNYE